MKAVFTSSRLLFREFTPDDCELIFDLNNDPEVVKFVHEAPTTKESAKEVLNNNIIA